jgi:hypothetical protein
MKTYTVIFAQDIPHYGSVDIEAENDDHAIEAARIYWRDVENDPVNDPDWNSCVSRRIVEITDESGKAIANDVRLDSYLLERATDEEIIIRAHAKELLESFERAFEILDGIAEKLLYEEGQPVTAIESREIEDIYNDAICELAPFQTLIRKARGMA